MNRRRLLSGVGAAVGLVAGCLSGPPGSDDATTSPVTSTRPELVTASLEVVDVSCGNRVSRATVTTRPDEARLVVDGALTGADACHRARLADAGFDDDGTFVVAVESVAPDDDRMCAQCLAEITYHITCTFSDGVPETVHVTHDGERAA